MTKTEKHKCNHVHAWIIAQAYKLLETNETDEAENLRFYIAAHASDALERWGVALTN